MSILADRAHGNPQGHAADDSAPAKITAPERHWYVAGPGGYCQACGLPERNTARHAPRPGV